MKITILVADEHDIVRSGIVSALAGGKDIEVVAETGEASEVLYLYRDLKPTLVILDVALTNRSGFELAKELLMDDPQAKILFLTMQLNENLLGQAVRAGAMGYVMKNVDRAELIDGVKQITRGKAYFSQSALRIMADYYIQTHRSPVHPQQVFTDFGLTGREREILSMIAESYTSQQIGEKLFISQRTVETHRSNIMQKLGIKNSAGLVRFAIENGLLTSSIAEG
jgi:DNA-binding NarL/FixJ family response regulator